MTDIVSVIVATVETKSVVEEPFFIIIRKGQTVIDSAVGAA
jgi:hypothetical protein